MPKKLKTPLEGAPSQPTENSLYDFLYHDTRRISSFLAQSDGGGFLSGYQESKNENTISKTGKSGEISGGIAGVGNLKIAGSTTPQIGNTSQQDKTYDPFWINALQLIENLENNNRIKKGVKGAKIGSFIQRQGHLIIFDTSIIKMMLNTNDMYSFFRKSMIEGYASSKNKKEAENEVDMAMKFAKIMPDNIQGFIVSNNGKYWFNLNSEYIVGDPSDISLKHGTFVQGKWTILGILDAYPNPVNQTLDDGRTTNDLVATEAETFLGQL